MDKYREYLPPVWLEFIVGTRCWRRRFRARECAATPSRVAPLPVQDLRGGEMEQLLDFLVRPAGTKPAPAAAGDRRPLCADTAESTTMTAQTAYAGYFLPARRSTSRQPAGR